MDGRRIFDQVIIDIEVTPGNQAPTDILISNLSVTENAPNDMPASDEETPMPPELLSELRELGLL